MRVTLLLAVLVAAPVGDRLRILDAVYGNPQKALLCDATAAVRNTCDGRQSCVLAVGNGICGDPAFQVAKRLFVTFKCGIFPARTVAAAEASVIRLFCNEPPPEPRS